MCVRFIFWVCVRLRRRLSGFLKLLMLMMSWGLEIVCFIGIGLLFRRLNECFLGIGFCVLFFVILFLLD